MMSPLIVPVGHDGCSPRGRVDVDVVLVVLPAVRVEWADQRERDLERAAWLDRTTR